MMDLVFLIGIPIAVVVVGFLGWKLRFDRRTARPERRPIRRREDARDWQRRFGTESLLSASFFPPTQNEVLETLSILDHLKPRWDTGDAAAIEHAFLHELALNFPALRKAGGTFAVPSEDGPESAAIAARREAFRTQRAQFNAMDQIISSPVGPSEATSGDAPAGLPEHGFARTGGNVWPVLLGGAAVLVAGVLAGTRFLPAAVNVKTALPPDAETIPTSASAVDAPAPAPAPEPATVEAEAVAKATPLPPVPPAPPGTQVAAAKPAPASSAAPSQAALNLQRQVVASKQRAVGKYPALAVEGSEINLRFVFRYKNLVHENSPRLLDPTWPEQLVEECAAAAGATAKRDGFTRVLGTPR